MRITILILLIICASLIVFTGVQATGSPELVQHVFGSGATASTSGNVAISATLGQPMVGTSTDASTTIVSGFWGFLEQVYRVFLPVILRN